jgi:hypothetical protein
MSVVGLSLDSSLLPCLLAIGQLIRVKQPIFVTLVESITVVPVPVGSLPAATNLHSIYSVDRMQLCATPTKSLYCRAFDVG